MIFGKEVTIFSKGTLYGIAVGFFMGIAVGVVADDTIGISPSPPVAFKDSTDITAKNLQRTIDWISDNFKTLNSNIAVLDTTR